MSPTVHTHETEDGACRAAADFLLRKLAEKPDLVLGLPTGKTPRGLYRELIARHRAGQADFSRVKTFNIDEYCGLAATDPGSFRRFMREELFDHINVPEEHIHFPRAVSADAVEDSRRYEESIAGAGGIDVMILGVGIDGHIGFNMPGSPIDSRTRLVRINEATRAENRIFFPPESEVPTQAVTMGLGTIMDSRCCLLLAFGERKAAIVAQALQRPVTAEVPASLLQHHPDTIVILDQAASSRLRRQDHSGWNAAIGQFVSH